MAGATPLPGKKDVASALLLKGSLFVHLDPRAADVIVPAWLKRQPQLVLQVGLDMPVPIPDLRMDELGVSGTLSFNRTAFTCSLPWDAVFALVGDDGRGMVWPNSMPKEIAAEVEREARRTRAALSEQGAIEDISESKRKRRAAQPVPGAKRLSATPAPKRNGLGLPGLELIAGEGDRARDTARRSERRSIPPYLRLVK
jgi:hypothetical protein